MVPLATQVPAPVAVPLDVDDADASPDIDDEAAYAGNGVELPYEEDAPF